MKPDLDQIYSELDLRPNCSLEDFKHAYRRRIALLHPDRPGGRAVSAENLATLSDLIWVYAMVTRFHRRYGRMPGGNIPRARSGELPIFLGQDRGHSSTGTDDSEKRNNRRARATVTLVALFVALVVLLASWGWLTGGGQRLNDAGAGQATATWAAIGGSTRCMAANVHAPRTCVWLSRSVARHDRYASPARIPSAVRMLSTRGRGTPAGPV